MAKGFGLLRDKDNERHHGNKDTLCSL